MHRGWVLEGAALFSEAQAFSKTRPITSDFQTLGFWTQIFEVPEKAETKALPGNF